MAGKPSRRATAPSARRTRDPGLAWFFVLLVGAIWITLVFGLPAVLVVALGLIPTGVAFLVDRSPGKCGAICVGGLNLAGVAPFLSMLIQGPNTMAKAAAILADPYAWLAMYGAAGMGWLLFLGLPPALTSFFKIRAQHRIAVLRAEQERLRREWGIGSEPAESS